MDLRILIEPQQGATYDDILRIAKLSEKLGFSGFFRSDHLLAMAGVDGRPGPTDAWTTLAGLARETKHIRLGTLVSAATFREPALLAVQVAQVDQMSGGRAELGLGAGWYEPEHRTHGLRFFDTSTRFDRLAEQLHIISGLWATPLGETFNFMGEHYQITNSPALPKPTQSTIPIIIGGLGRRRTPELAVRYAQEFNVPFASPEMTATTIMLVRRALELAKTRSGDMIFSAAQGIACGSSKRDIDRRAAASGIPAERFRAKNLSGRPSAVIEQIMRYKAAGCERLYLSLPDLNDEEHLELLADGVLKGVAPALPTPFPSGQCAVAPCQRVI